MRISSNEPSSVILSQTMKKIKKLKRKITVSMNFNYVEYFDTHKPESFVDLGNLGYRGHMVHQQ